MFSVCISKRLANSEPYLQPGMENSLLANQVRPLNLSFNVRQSSFIYLFAIKGRLAESWEIPDPLTYLIKIRQGVHWHKKAPMNGRALTAKDIEFNFHRLFGIGSGFTEMINKQEKILALKG